jgi:hypothetical protein
MVFSPLNPLTVPFLRLHHQLLSAVSDRLSPPLSLSIHLWKYFGRDNLRHHRRTATIVTAIGSSRLEGTLCQYRRTQKAQRSEAQRLLCVTMVGIPKALRRQEYMRPEFKF